jgi:hypothetical protein
MGSALTRIENVDDLATFMERLASELGRKRGSGPLSNNDVQQAASELTRTQLMLNELVRIEVRQHGASRQMATRIAVLEGRIREIRDSLLGPAGG